MFLRPIHAIPNAVDSWRNGWATKDLARALASGGDSVGLIDELARTNGTFNPFKQQMLADLLVANPLNK